ncbi:hypothetical protein XA68_15546 [Ophiocordyceps unilateralis]|uniref:Uncharacterized protein n=1 Tax=Ophiocordyceps unilateralis TaxID=268505 RepID=A0A2A9PLB5_OPHUN|nr:hypothetical protein XA68_15546 [Ophiocordyceps unilateralis]
MKVTVLFLTALAGLAQAQPLPAPQPKAVLQARQIPNPLAIPLLLAELPQGAFYLFSSPINVAKALATNVVEKGVGGLNKFLDKIDNKRKMKNGGVLPSGKGSAPPENGAPGAPGAGEGAPPA